jgi:phosphoribosylglycinamide formyltransferase-1
MANLIEAINGRKLPVNIILALADKADAPCLQKATQLGVKAFSLLPKEFNNRADYDRALAQYLLDKGVDTVCLAGFMRILGSEFVSKFPGRILNIHPSLLPAFSGLNAQKQALEHGVKISGCTVHFVDEGLDSGPIILQKAVPVLADDTVESLSSRILVEEHKIYPLALELLAKGRLTAKGRQVIINE